MSTYTLGLGCDRGTSLQTLREAVQSALALAGANASEVEAAASITIKRDETGLLALAAEQGWPLHFYAAAELDVVDVPNPSETVRYFTGTGSVSEAAALLAAGASDDMTALVVEKFKHLGTDVRNATVSIARKHP